MQKIEYVRCAECGCELPLGAKVFRNIGEFRGHGRICPDCFEEYLNDLRSEMSGSVDYSDVNAQIDSDLC